jgi:hypothetical protein
MYEASNISASYLFVKINFVFILDFLFRRAEFFFANLHPEQLLEKYFPQSMFFYGFSKGVFGFVHHARTAELSARANSMEMELL